MSAIIPKRPPPRAPLKLTVNSSSATTPNSSTSTSTTSSSSSSSGNSIITTTTNESKRPSLKVSSISSSLGSLSISIPKDSSSHYTSFLNPPSSSSSSSASPSASTTSSNEEEADSHKWGKGDQARMAGEIKEIITRPVGLEEELSGGVPGTGLRVVVERRVRSNSRVGGVRPSVLAFSESGTEKEDSDTSGGGGGKKEIVSTKGGEEEEEEEEEGLLQAELDVSPATLIDLGRLGEGASGEVRKVRHTPTGIIMAKKTIATSPNPKLHKQHLRELLFMRECYNPHIVQYYGAFLEDNDSQIGICMEYCEGGSLEVLYKKVKANGWRTGEKVLGKIAESVLNGLVYLHDRKIIHRDIKPSNVLVSLDGQVKLCDFGVSGELINSLAGTFLGTIFYLSPERIKGGKYSINADVWSMTLTVLEVALNRYPFPGENEAPLTGPFELLTYLINMDSNFKLQDEIEKGIKYTNAFRDFIKQGLDKDASTRPTPSKLFSHPWIRRSIDRNPPTNLSGWVKDLST